MAMTRTAKELAEAVGANVEGDATVEVRGVAAPERAGLHDLIYAEQSTPSAPWLQRLSA
jgi:UDP-3-O-[3-hydroxymyristoyl] glucosamine N-acyltransferase